MDFTYLDTLDKTIFLALNGSDSIWLDRVMQAITSTSTWIPVAIALLYVIIKNNNMRSTVLIVGLIALSILVADQFSSSFCKPFFARLRPSQDPSFMHLVDVVDGYRGGRYGFISSHAANTFAVATLLSLIMRHWGATVMLFVWSVLCSYSRIYLGVHYPGDILAGATCGVIVGLITYKIYEYVFRLMNNDKEEAGYAYATGSSGYATTGIYFFLSVLALTYLCIILWAFCVS